MNKELQLQLARKYRVLFGAESRVAIDVGNGWYSLIDELFSGLEAELIHKISKSGQMICGNCWHPPHGVYCKGLVSKPLIKIFGRCLLWKAEKCRCISYYPVSLAGCLLGVTNRMGMLNVRLLWESPRMTKMVTRAKNASAETCEICGNSGKLIYNKDVIAPKLMARCMLHWETS